MPLYHAELISASGKIKRISICKGKTFMVSVETGFKPVSTTQVGRRFAPLLWNATIFNFSR